MLDWIVAHWTDILAVYGGVVAIATFIVKLTPSVKDDTILAKIIDFLDHFSTVFKKKDAATIEAAEKKSKK